MTCDEYRPRGIRSGFLECTLGLKWDTSDIIYIAINIKFIIIIIIIKYIYIYLAVVFYICAELCEASTKYLVSNVLFLILLLFL